VGRLLVAALLGFAALAVVRLPDAWRRRARLGPHRRAALLAMLAGWLLFGALIGSTRYLTWARGEWYALQARQAVAAGDPQRARLLLEQARASDRSNALRALALADLAFEQGAYRDALDLYAQATAIEDRNLYAHAMRERTAALLGLPEIARAEQAALAGYGRDNNELLFWSWGFFDDPPRASVVPGDPMALGQYEGFAPPTADLPSGRWTLGAARVRLQGSCDDLALRVRGPAARALMVEVEGAIVPQTTLLTGSDQEIRIPLSSVPGCAERPPIVVRLRSATGLLDIERAPWMVGVALLEARVE
jgi:tetratricopeptide (TPR) repeat protein